MPNIGKGTVLGVCRSDIVKVSGVSSRDSNTVELYTGSTPHGITAGQWVKLYSGPSGTWANPPIYRIIESVTSTRLFFTDVGANANLGIIEVSPFQPLVKVRSVAAPSFSAAAVDTTGFEDTAARTFIKGVKDWGEVTFSSIADPVVSDSGGKVQYAYALALAASDAREGWFVQWPDKTTMACEAILTGFAPSVPMDDLITTQVTLKITGEVQWILNEFLT
jgi:hypothetical protein